MTEATGGKRLYNC